MTGSLQAFFKKYTDEWRWAINFFWIAVGGYNPDFPFTPLVDFHWDMDLIPLGGEYIYGKMATGEFVGVSERHALLDGWLALREKWKSSGVLETEFRRVRDTGI